jgi:hypothetical protein
MKRITLGFPVATLTFLMGIAVTGLFPVHPHRSAEKAPVPALMVAESPVKSSHPEGWKKIEVENAFSFYVPPDMKSFDAIGCPFGVDGNFKNQSLSVGYDYIPKVLMDDGYRGKLSCKVLQGASADRTSYRISEVVIGGRGAQEIFRRSGEPEHGHISLCFPDLGDGAILRFGAGSSDERAMDVAIQIVDSIEFR